MMGGEIGVQSVARRGSTFWFNVCLPIGTSTSRRKEDTPDLAGTRALVVDDNAANRQIARCYLEMAGAEVTEASSGPEALAFLSNSVSTREPYAVAVVDLHMPNMSGLDLAQAIRSHEGASHLPIVFWASHHDRETVSESRLLGASSFLVKPVPEDQFVLAVARAIGASAACHPEHITPAKIPAAAWKAKVLVAEDNPTSQKVIRLMLMNMGHEVDIVGDGQQAVTAVASSHYDLVFMDCQMPKTDGYAAVRLIRQSGQKVPVIALTANALDGAREACRTAGFDDYLAKPIAMEDITKKLNEWLGAPAPPNADRLAERPPSREAIASELSAFLDGLEKVGISISECRDLADSFAETTPELLGDLARAVEANDATAAAQLAHTLRGAFGSMGLRSSESLLRQIEEKGRNGDVDISKRLVPVIQQHYSTARDWFSEMFQ